MSGSLSGAISICLAIACVACAERGRASDAAERPRGTPTGMPGNLADAGSAETRGRDAASNDGGSRANPASIAGAGRAGDAGRCASNSGRGGDDLGAGAAKLRPITLRFKAVVGNQNFDCWTSYPAPGTGDLMFTPMDFRFFVHDVRLVTRGGGEVRMQLDAHAPVQSPDVALLDFAADEGSCFTFKDTGTNLTVTGQVPEGDYTSIVFTTGVPEELNHQDVVTAIPPLNDTSMYWAWSNGYRFVSVMLAAAAVQTGVHIGAAGCTGSQSAGFTCAQPNRNRVQLDGFDPDASTIIADFGAVIAGLDLSVQHQCHGGEPECAPAFAAFGLGPDGQALATQRVFRLE